MNTYAVDIQAAAAVAPFNVAVTAPEGFDQAVRRALRKLEDSGAYRVLAVRPNPSEYDSHAYEVEVQTTAGVEFKDDVFTVTVIARKASIRPNAARSVGPCSEPLNGMQRTPVRTCRTVRRAGTTTGLCRSV